MKDKINTIAQQFIELQNLFCKTIEQEDGKATFLTDRWQHREGGGGITRVLSDGGVIEQGGVNFSHITGDQMPHSASAQRHELTGCSFEALGVSVVMHPTNPYVPTSHMNVRLFFATSKTTGKTFWWSGGGFDLTPYYGFTEDCIAWHQAAKAACDTFDLGLYPRFKQWCDDYFYIKHRQEARGIGGIFFDDFNRLSLEETVEFLHAVAHAYLYTYQRIIARRKSLTYGEREREFQRYRRGRYVEFNLVYDRGTLFGLQSQGRTESILMSLPPQVNWHYQWHPKPGSPEHTLYTDFLPVRDWANL